VANLKKKNFRAPNDLPNSLLKYCPLTLNHSVYISDLKGLSVKAMPICFVLVLGHIDPDSRNSVTERAGQMTE
jgi:hypothetical protein